MKTKVLIALAAMFVIIYFLPIPVTNSRTVTVKASYQKVLFQVNDLNNWKTWWPDSTGTYSIGDTVFVSGKNRFVLQRKDPLAIIVSEKNRTIFHYISAQPINDSTTTINWSQVRYIRTALAQYVQSFFGKYFNSSQALQSLKLHVENAAGYYGYNISVQPVDDTFILVLKKPCLRKEVPSCLKTLFAQLDKELKTVKYQGKAERMFYIDSSSADTTRVMAGLSITKPLKVNLPYEMMRMPRAHIVVGEITGPYSEVARVHNNILRYMRDHGIAPVAVPYEKIFSIPANTADSANMRVKVYHPSMIP